MRTKTLSLAYARGSTGGCVPLGKRYVSIPFVALLILPLAAQNEKKPTYDDDVKPIFRRRCFACHNASEMKSGLNLETYAGVMKGGGSGDILKPGRPTGSTLYLAVAHEGNGIPRMPLGGGKIPDAEIAAIRDWIQFGALENAKSVVNVPAGPSLEFNGSSLNRPTGQPAMPQDLPSVARTRKVHALPITALAASPWAPLVAVADHDSIRLFDIEKRIQIGALAFPEGIPYVLRFSRDGSILLAGGGYGAQSGKVVLFDVKSGKRIAVVGNEMDIVLAADVTPDGKLVALGGPGKVVKGYDVASGKLLYEIKKHTDWITALEFNPDGNRLATGDRSGGIHMWESKVGGILVSLSEHKDSVTSLSWRGDGQLLASGSEDGQLIIWDAREGWPMSTTANAHKPTPKGTVFGKVPSGVLSLQFMSDGRVVSVGRDKTIRIWGSDGKARAASTPSDSLLTKVAASFDSKITIAGDYAGRVMLWDGKQISFCCDGKQ